MAATYDLNTLSSDEFGSLCAIFGSISIAESAVSCIAWSKHQACAANVYSAKLCKKTYLYSLEEVLAQHPAQ
eukprot:scaffold154536_cov20-Prasinocladus_malaysianus.AAC.2